MDYKHKIFAEVAAEKVVSIGLFWFCYMSFLYNGVYFLQIFFDLMLSQYQRRTLILGNIFKCWELLFDSKTFSFLSYTYIYKNIYLPMFSSFICHFKRRHFSHSKSSRPKKCSFQSPLEPFWLTMTSLIESFNMTWHTPLYKNWEIEIEIVQWRLQKNIVIQGYIKKCLRANFKKDRKTKRQNNK